ncbi:MULTISPECIES: alpha/beta fold hydrolase [Actinoalloteichus]|uniref:Hydrolase or acyltransferase of alpha/beta superfamily n=1 Tax=Actinoalloteichus fjordicus TaxID=1612552 RepID=A0AAC9L7J8_9PSEU|nr:MULTISPECIES: alpha/beta hydrolase [Actinoalloteichus]APU12346.1 putative hydrolase or acyltransferase of alpha/beta superfamily [Actinoalloteichus fjordicus]APU18298.1 putative hydrolase or acyltransferase of alpha/beta superfamily [Actinoalloteichus sp. GBA129-24]
MRPLPDPSTTRVSGPWTHHDVSANGISLHIASAGEGPLVLFVHGFPEFWWSWRGQLLALADAGFRAVAVDLRGYGDSDKPPRGYDGWTLAGDLAGLIKAMGERRAALVGHGWGGLLAWTTAALHPRLVSSLSVLSAPHPLALRRALALGLTRPWRQAERAQLTAAGHLFRAQLPTLPEAWLTKDGAATVERLIRSWSGPKWQTAPEFEEVVRRNRAAMLVPGAAHSALEYYRWAVRSQLRGEGGRFAEAVDRRLPVPVLRVQGRLDPWMRASTSAASTAWTGPNSIYRELPEVGHFPHQEAPHATNRLLIKFLTGELHD